MRAHTRILSVLLPLFLALPAFAQQRATAAGAELWRDRGDVAALDVLNGPGGKAHQPGTRFLFIEESKGGTSPKFDVQDESGVKWKVKLGPEVKSETAATRLLWAAGYYADEDYYRSQIHVQRMKRLSRGREFVSNDGIVREVRLERHDVGKKLQNWGWYDSPFAGTREFNGLRVMMALINNWDLKEDNNDVYGEGGVARRYVISDLGASLGRTGSSFGRSKGVIKDYAESDFIKKATPEYVDFVLDSRPCFLTSINYHYYRARARMENVARHIPVADARWLGDRLGRLSAEQIRDCFRAAGFSPAEVEGYARVVMQRIEALKKL